MLEAADAHHGGDSCVFREFLGSRQNLIAVNLLIIIILVQDLPHYHVDSSSKITY